MKFPVFCKISLQYLWRYRRRYLFLFLALGFGFGVVMVISSLKDGMKENLYLSAQSHYAGDVVAMGYEPGKGINHHLTQAEMDAVFTAAKKLNIDFATTAVRTTLMGRDEGSIYFNGNAASLKYIVGVDWNRETEYFAKLSYVEAPVRLDEGSVLLSAPIARELGAREGDSIILETYTVTDQRNTGNFIVAGIVEDSSFFGYYKVYMARIALNRLIGFADNDCSLIGFFLKDRTRAEPARIELYGELGRIIQTGPLVHDRAAYDDETNKTEPGITTFLLTLPVYLSEVARLMDAIDLASYVLYTMMLAIIMVSAGVTCRLILHERTRETGTMRAIGFYESDVRLIFKLEIFCLALFSMAAGFFLAVVINKLLSHASFSWFPGFEVFMQNGRLSALYLPGTIAINVLAVYCMLALAVQGPVFRNSRNPLPEMLSGGVM
ncbi:MAG: ABC transporter permease [Treponema sp.]|jgi:ABC-type lipoprotein release transport system permease subunit|nr:ABC transporter permease [Treponema sp.]